LPVKQPRAGLPLSIASMMGKTTPSGFRRPAIRDCPPGHPTGHPAGRSAKQLRPCFSCFTMDIGAAQIEDRRSQDRKRAGLYWLESAGNGAAKGVVRELDPASCTYR